MKKLSVLLVFSSFFVGCGGKKASDEKTPEQLFSEYLIENDDSTRRANFLDGCTAGTLEVKDSDNILYIMIEPTGTTTFNNLAKQYYLAAKREVVVFDACVIVDREYNEIGRYEP